MESNKDTNNILSMSKTFNHSTELKTDAEALIKEKIITLRKPLEVKYLAQFVYECNYLGFKCKIDNRSIEDIYYRNNYI